MVYLMKPSWMGTAWMYGAMTTACFLRYNWKESPAQRPFCQELDGSGLLGVSKTGIL